MSLKDDSLIDRVRSLGVRAASLPDLLAVGYSRRAEDAAMGEAMARQLLARCRSVEGLGEVSGADIAAITGLEGFEVLRAQALVELGRRVANAGKAQVQIIENPADVYELLERYRHEKKEHFLAVLLDAKKGVLRVAEIHVGTLTASIVGAREVFREAIREGASSLIVAHNHPSGDPEPSPEDVQVTRKLAEIGTMLDIPVVDHVVLGHRRFVSLKQRGLFE